MCYGKPRQTQGGAPALHCPSLLPLLTAGLTPCEDNQKMSIPCNRSHFPCRSRSRSQKPEVLVQGESRRPAAPGQERDAISAPSFPEPRGAAIKESRQQKLSLPATRWGDGPARQGVSMNYVSWQHGVVLLEGYPPHSMGQQGSAHTMEGPEAESRTRS